MGKLIEMLGIFKKRTPREILELKYKSLLEESFKLSTTNRKESDLARAKAEDVLKQIEALDQQ